MSLIHRIFSVVALLSLILTGCAGPEKHAQLPTEPASPEQTIPLPTTDKISSFPNEAAITVALLLPLSGSSQNVGQAMFDAAQLALFNANMPNLTLLTIDTEAKDEVVAANTKKAIEQGAKIIIGPVFSKTTAIVAKAAKPYSVNILSFSNDQTLAGNGVFLMGFMLDEQIKRVADYAISQEITDFYALVPANSYGNLALKSLRDVVVQGNGSIIHTEFYSPKGQDLPFAVKNISDALNNAESGSVKALFIPEGGEKIAAITALLAQQDVDKIKLRLLGTGQWDDKATFQNSYLAGGWFASFNPEQHTLFEERFQEQYGYKPLRIASLAYDAVALAFNMASQPGGADFSQASLTNARGFSGTDGVFRLQKNGITERKLVVLQVEATGGKVVDSAVQGFENNAE